MFGQCLFALKVKISGSIKVNTGILIVILLTSYEYNMLLCITRQWSISLKAVLLSVDSSSHLEVVTLKSIKFF